MSLKQIYCQDRAIGVLQRAFAAGRVPHAYIFAGPVGVGKFTTAREFAKLLLCKNPTSQTGFADSCGICRSCQLLEADSHPDFQHVYKELLEFTKDGKGKSPPVEFPIDVVREFVIEKVSGKPGLSQRKVFVLSEAEKLNNSSQNCLLKVLEEPPAYCCIILLCTRPDKLFATIKSRAHAVRFGLIAEDKIAEKLSESGLDKKQARYFAGLAQGQLGLAWQWAQLELAGANLYQIKTELVDCIADPNYSDALDLAQQLLRASKSIAAAWAELAAEVSKSDLNRRAAKSIVQIIISALHDAMLAGVEPAKPPVNFDQTEQIRILSRRFDPDSAAAKIADCYRTMRWVEAAVNEKLIFEQLLLNLADSDRIRV